jgi:predicted ArsR family transcriptional regulator
MKTSLSVYDFRDAFHKAGRGEQFSYDGLGILFEYIEEVEDSCGEEFELDVIGLCCDFAESDWQTIASDYSIEIDENESEDEQEAQVLDYLADQGVLVGNTKSGIVYRQF